MLQVPPWELLGFYYEKVCDAPICWREWAFDFLAVKRKIEASQSS